MDTTIKSNAFSSKMLKNKDYNKDQVFVRHHRIYRLSFILLIQKAL
jgi:hypothetical protein